MPTNAQGRLDAAKLAQNGEALRQALGSSPVARVFRHTIMANLCLPDLNSVALKAARGQVANTLAATACALERYRLAHQAYPQDLASLTPNYLRQVPRDLFTGAPLQYRLQPDGQFLLYSVGQNGKDDGGQVVLLKSGGNADVTQGDWVWKSTAER